MRKDEMNIIYPFNSEQFINHWQLWKQFKKEQFRFTYKGIISEQAALISLSELSNNDEQIAIRIINQSISNGWRGLFNLKEPINGKQNAISTNQDQRNRIISGTL